MIGSNTPTEMGQTVYDGNDPLFTRGDLYDVLERHYSQLRRKIDEIAKDELLGTPEEDLIAYFLDYFEIHALELRENGIQMEPPLETTYDVSDWPDYGPAFQGPIIVPAISVTVTLPFVGSAELWMIRPSSVWYVFPKGVVRKNSTTNGTLEMTVAFPSREGADAEIRRLIDDNLREVRQCLAAQKSQIDIRTAGLEQSVRDAIRARKNRLRLHEGIATSLNIPIRHKETAPPVKLELRRRLARPLPRIQSGSYQPEPGIAPEEYEHIVQVLRNALCTFETTRSTYRRHDEEELRDILLAILNMYYGGGATGETFRTEGKTDIRIEDGGRAAFVAECKVWRGLSEFQNGLEQLLSYLTWRDSKAAYVVFNKDVAGFTDIQQKVTEFIPSFGLYKRLIPSQPVGEWRAVFSSKSDPLREITVHIFLVDLFSSNAP